MMKGYCQTGLWRMLFTRLNYWLNSGTYTNVMTERLLPVDYVGLFLSQIKPPEWPFFMIQDSLPMASPLSQLFFYAGKLRCRISQEVITWVKPPHFVLPLFCLWFPFLASSYSGVCHSAQREPNRHSTHCDRLSDPHPVFAAQIIQSNILLHSSSHRGRCLRPQAIFIRAE